MLVYQRVTPINSLLNGDLTQLSWTKTLDSWLSRMFCHHIALLHSICRFPKIGVPWGTPSHHPFIEGCSLLNHLFWDTPMTLETTIYARRPGPIHRSTAWTRRAPRWWTSKHKGDSWGQQHCTGFNGKHVAVFCVGFFFFLKSFEQAYNKHWKSLKPFKHPWKFH